MKHYNNNEKTRTKNFVCRICGSTQYDEYSYSIGPLSWGTYHRCAGCTIMFRDPQKFSKSENTEPAVVE